MSNRILQHNFFIADKVIFTLPGKHCAVIAVYYRAIDATINNGDLIIE